MLTQVLNPDKDCGITQEARRIEEDLRCGMGDPALCVALNFGGWRIERAGSQPGGETRTELGNHREALIAVRETIILSIFFEGLANSSSNRLEGQFCRPDQAATERPVVPAWL